MTPAQIAQKAEELRAETPSLGTYKQIFNDTLVLIRELAKNLDKKK